MKKSEWELNIASPGQKKAIRKMLSFRGFDEDFIFQEAGKEIENLTMDEADRVIKKLSNPPRRF